MMDSFLTCYPSGLISAISVLDHPNVKAPRPLWAACSHHNTSRPNKAKLLPNLCGTLSHLTNLFSRTLPMAGGIEVKSCRQESR